MREIKHLSVHQWIRSAIPDSQQPTSPIGFLFLKLPPPPCAVLLVIEYSSFYRELAQRSHKEILPRDLFERSCQKTSYRDLYRDLANRALIQILLQRSCQETSYTETW